MRRARRFAIAILLASAGCQALPPAPGGTPQAGIYRLVPAARQAAAPARGGADAQGVYDIINREQPETGRSWHVYDLRNGLARDVAYVLRQAFTPDDVAMQGQPGSAAAAEKIRIIADSQNNAILIYGTPAETGRIDAMLEIIDIPPVQVRIDATIAEVDLDSALQYGTQFFFKSGGINAVLSTGGTAALATNFPGFVLSGSGGDAAPVAISALQAVTKVRVLSTPELTVQDGHDASLQVGSLVPYLTQTARSTTTSQAENSVNYRQTGIVLRVTPHVGGDGLVTLDIAQEITAVAPGVTTPGIDSPTFSERALSSRAAIGDGQTIGLAGLISDDDPHQNSGIPFLKHIPLLGDLAGTQTNSRTRTELMVLITPHVIRAQTGADELTADLRDQFASPSPAPAPAKSE